MPEIEKAARHYTAVTTSFIDREDRLTALMLADRFEKHTSTPDLPASPELVVDRARAYLAFLKGSESAVEAADTKPFAPPSYER
jgi:hypothetical protein